MFSDDAAGYDYVTLNMPELLPWLPPRYMGCRADALAAAAADSLRICCCATRYALTIRWRLHATMPSR